MPNLYTIYDEKAQTFGTPWPSHTHGSAERALRESMGQPDSPHGKFPEDFSLYCVGSFDELTGAILVNDGPPALIVRATQLITA